MVANGSSEVYYQLVKGGVNEEIATQLDELVSSGKLNADDLTDTVKTELKDVNDESMNSFLEELNSTDLSQLKNKSAYLIGLIKTVKKSQKPAEVGNQEEADNTDSGLAVDVDNQISIGKNVIVPNPIGPNEAAVKRVLARTGYLLEITSGQRNYGPTPELRGAPPKKGCEVFIGGLLRETYEDYLVPMLEACGEIYDLRIMTNPDGQCKGFAFCIFTTKEAAENAVKQMNGKQLNRSRVMKVNIHSPNTRLFVGGVDKSKSKEEILEALSAHTDGIEEVILKPDSANPNRHRGFVFVDYCDHKHASGALKRLTAPSVKVFHKALFAEFAEPQAEVSDEVMSTVKVLYVHGLSPSVTEETIRDRFSPYGDIESVKKVKDYAFVHFNNREDALQAMNDLNGQKVGDSAVEVTLAKPSQNNKKNDQGRGGYMGRQGGGMGGGGRGGSRDFYGGGRGGGGGGGRGGPPRRGGGGPSMRSRGEGAWDQPPARAYPEHHYDGFTQGGGGGGGDYYSRPAPPSRYESSYGGSAYSDYGRQSSYESRPMSRGRSPGAARGGGRGRGGARGGGSPRGGYGGAAAAPYGGGYQASAGTKRPAGGYGAGSGGYGGMPEAKRAKSLMDWDVKPIPQQPLAKADPYYTPPAAAQQQSWYQNPW